MAEFKARNGFSRGILILGLASLTLVVLAGIKFIMSDGSSEARSVSQEPQNIFAAPDDAPPPEISPLSRSESTSGGSLDMFSETNAGYYGEDESTATATAQEAPAPKTVKSVAKPAAKKPAAAKLKAKTTTVPRMKMVPFKSITPTNVAPSNTGGQQGIPDVSAIMQKAQQQAGQNASGD